MKKLITLLTLILVTISVYSQDVKFLRASRLTYATRETPESKFAFSPTTDVNVLIKIETNKVTIYSKETQVYRLVEPKRKTETYVEYLATNSDGLLCNIMLMILPDVPKKLFLSVEFSDCMWYYTTEVE